MHFNPPLIKGTLLGREKRFISYIKLEDGSEVTAHCPNTGSMTGCMDIGSPVLISKSDNPKRKLAYTWEMVQTGKYWIGINTRLPNLLVREALEIGRVPELSGYASIRSEVPYGENSRIDLLLENNSKKCYVEIKNVTLVEGNVARFPDAVTTRGQKHLRELMNMVKEGHRAVIFYLVQREDGKLMQPADDIDPVYGQLLRQAVSQGVEALVYRAEINPDEIVLAERLPLELPGRP